MNFSGYINNATWNDIIIAFLEDAIDHIYKTAICKPPLRRLSILIYLNSIEINTIKTLRNAINSVQLEQTKLLVHIDSHPKFRCVQGCNYNCDCGLTQ